MTELSASILAADLAALGEAVRAADAAGVDRFHVDVMDGHFVPNLTFGRPVLEAVRRHTEKPIEAHLMVKNPEELVPEMVAGGANAVFFHYEATPHPHRLLGRIRSLGAEAGIAINPGTPVETLVDLVFEADYVLLMSVNPGFAGQSFIPRTYERLKRLKPLTEAAGARVAVDGGVKPENAAELVRLGASVLVAASAIYFGDVAERVKAFRRALG